MVSPASTRNVTRARNLPCFVIDLSGFDGSNSGSPSSRYLTLSDTGSAAKYNFFIIGNNFSQSLHYHSAAVSILPRISTLSVMVFRKFFASAVESL